MGLTALLKFLALAYSRVAATFIRPGPAADDMGRQKVLAGTGRTGPVPASLNRRNPDVC
jgi:hypothetical protein